MLHHSRGAGQFMAVEAAGEGAEAVDVVGADQPEVVVSAALGTVGEVEDDAAAVGELAGVEPVASPSTAFLPCVARDRMREAISAATALLAAPLDAWTVTGIRSTECGFMLVSRSSRPRARNPWRTLSTDHTAQAHGPAR